MRKRGWELSPPPRKLVARPVIYLSSTTKTSPRQSLLMVQVVAPDTEPSLPIQSEEKMKNFPSCETVPIPSAASKFEERPVMKLCANRQVFPLPSTATALLSMHPGRG